MNPYRCMPTTPGPQPLAVTPMDMPTITLRRSDHTAGISVVRASNASLPLLRRLTPRAHKASLVWEAQRRHRAPFCCGQLIFVRFVCAIRQHHFGNKRTTTTTSACTGVHSFRGWADLILPRTVCHSGGPAWPVSWSLPDRSRRGQRQCIIFTSLGSWQASPYPW